MKYSNLNNLYQLFSYQKNKNPKKKVIYEKVNQITILHKYNNK